MGSAVDTIRFDPQKQTTCTSKVPRILVFTTMVTLKEFSEGLKG